MNQIFRMLRRQIAIVVLTPLLALAAAIIFVFTATPLYTANSTVFVDLRRANMVETNNAVVPSNFGTDDATIQSQVHLIRSVPVLQRVVDKLKLTADPEFMPAPGLRDRFFALFGSANAEDRADAEDSARAASVELLDERVKVIRQGNTFLVDINVTSRDPKKAAAIANAVASEYFAEQIKSKYAATRIGADWLKRQIEDLKSQVMTSDRAVEDFRAQHNLIAAKGLTINEQQIADLNNKLIEARAVAAEARAKYEQAKAIAEEDADPGSLTEALASDTIARLRAQYAELAKNEADLSVRYGRRHPLLAPVHAQMSNTQRLIKQEVQRILEARLHTYRVAVAREQSLKNSLDELQGVSSESGQAQVRLRELQREAESNRAVYEAFLARHKEMTARERLALPDARIVTLAEAPSRPSYPKTLLILGFAPLLGLAIGGVLALLRDRLDRRVKTLDQVEAISGIVGIAAVPIVGLPEQARLTRRGQKDVRRYDAKTMRLLPPALQPALLRYALEEPMSPFAEAVRAVRLAVQRAAKERSARVVMVTSAVGGEGKTTLAANLAATFALIGVKTILVEGDLRNPNMTLSLCPRAEAGLFEVATGAAPLHQVTLVDPSNGLSVLPAPIPSTGVLTEFAFTEGVTAVLAELRRHYDIIIVDSPPLLPLVDGRALAEHADCVILAVAWDRIAEDVLQRTVELLAPVRDRVLGTVMTQVDLKRLHLYDRYLSASYLDRYSYGMAARSVAAE